MRQLPARRSAVRVLTPRSRCPGNARHWFAAYGIVGLHLPVCVRCGAPNPRPLSDAEWDELPYWRDEIGQHAQLALIHREEGRALVTPDPRDPVCHAHPTDATFIAAADPPTVLALIARVRELEGQVPAWRRIYGGPE